MSEDENRSPGPSEGTTSRASDLPKLESIVVGRLAGFDETDRPLVEFSGSPSEEPVPARTTVGLELDQIGSEVTLVFEGADPSRPIVMGVIREAFSEIATNGPAGTLDLGEVLSVDTDGDRLQLTAKREIELRCGKATVVLTRAGKILLRGTYLSNRSSGVNRIKGGSVQIN